MTRNISLLLVAMILFTGCNSKHDITEKNIIPAQVMGETVTEDYRTTEYILKNADTWNKSLEDKTIKFNMYVEDVFGAIDNKKKYLQKIYNVNYYDFDDKGFNSSVPVVPTRVNPTKTGETRQVSNISSPSVSQANSSVSQNKNSSSAVIKQEHIEKLQQSEDKKVKATESSNSSNTKTGNQKQQNIYDSQIFNEYNF